LVADLAVWVGWVVLSTDLGYLVLFVVIGDIPPFVFYVLLLLVGSVAQYSSARGGADQKAQKTLAASPPNRLAGLRDWEASQSERWRQPC
jgi:hypothetical protein